MQWMSFSYNFPEKDSIFLSKRKRLTCDDAKDDVSSFISMKPSDITTHNFEMKLSQQMFGMITDRIKDAVYTAHFCVQLQP